MVLEFTAAYRSIPEANWPIRIDWTWQSFGIDIAWWVTPEYHHLSQIADSPRFALSLTAPSQPFNPTLFSQCYLDHVRLHSGMSPNRTIFVIQGFEMRISWISLVFKYNEEKSMIIEIWILFCHEFHLCSNIMKKNPWLQKFGFFFIMNFTCVQYNEEKSTITEIWILLYHEFHLCSNIMKKNAWLQKFGLFFLSERLI